MPVLNVAYVGSEDFARALGKKGDVRDIESYVHKENTKFSEFYKKKLLHFTYFLNLISNLLFPYYAD